jgi:DNA-directed RNA polymerase specialized sigma24 family protein
VRRLGERGGLVRYEDDFVAYYRARAEHLRTMAYLLCGDWHQAQDLAQTTFTKLYRAWRRIERHDTVDQYARRVLLRAFLDERRRPWRREVTAEALDSIVAAGPAASPDDSVVLRAADGLLGRNGQEPDLGRSGESAAPPRLRRR